MKQLKAILILPLLTMFIFSCSEEPEEPLLINKISQVGANPFSVPSMQKAMRVLEGSSHYAAAGSPTLNPRVTHYYVVFSPQNNEELDLIAKSGEVELFEEPLDVSFLGEDRAIFEYNLASLGQDSPGHQFTTVRKEFNFPNVDYQIIAEIYLPFEDLHLLTGTDTRGSAAGMANMLPCDQYMMAQEWENQALMDNGYEDFIEVDECDDQGGGGGSGGGGSSNPYPANQWGRMRIYDNTPGVQRLIPISGVRVTTTRFLSWKRSDTNAEGYYKVNSPHHEKKSQYHIKWEDDDFRIIAHDGGQAKLEGPDQTGPWSFDIGDNTKAQWYGTAFSAAKQYYDGERYGLAKPQNGNLFRTTIKVRDNDCTSRYAPHADIPVVGALFFNDIKVCVVDYKSNMSRLYGVTVHELTHSAHFKTRPGNFSEEILFRPGNRRVLESWAEGVEWWFAINKYRTLSGNPNWGYNNSINPNSLLITNYQERRTDASRSENDLIYTSIVVDLIDNFNQQVEWNDSQNRPNDQVSGYTIQQIEEALYTDGGISLFSNWENHLRILFENPTEGFLDELFDSWN